MSEKGDKQEPKTPSPNDPASTTEPDAPEEEPKVFPPNPPRTTTGGWFTAPKFGSAGSGGLEIEPGPERD
ncbi:MAG: hypothetical protein ABIT38_13195 [Gemmatimonadaceae bacterium]